jgi:DNA-binding protein HU-beta
MVSKSQLAQRIAARGATPAQAAHAVDAVLSEITAALATGEKVTLVGFGSFEPVARPARMARNPRTGDTVPVAAATVPRFHAGARLKAVVDGGEVSLGPVGALADGLTALVVPETRTEPGGEPAVAAKPAKSATKDDKHKGKGAKGKKSGKKK